MRQLRTGRPEPEPVLDEEVPPALAPAPTDAASEEEESEASEEAPSAPIDPARPRVSLAAEAGLLSRRPPRRRGALSPRARDRLGPRRRAPLPHPDARARSRAPGQRPARRTPLPRGRARLVPARRLDRPDARRQRQHAE